MKARIVRDGNFWVGEVYGRWYMMLGIYERVGWGSVTGKCYTQWGARRELEKWKRKHCGKEFEL